MKTFAIAALVATTQAALGDDCYYDTTICEDGGLFCASWEDSQYGDMKSCEDCAGGQYGGPRQITDSYGDFVDYLCPPESEPTPEAPAPSGGGGPAPDSEEGAAHIAVSFAAIVAAVSVIA